VSSGIEMKKMIALEPENLLNTGDKVSYHSTLFPMNAGGNETSHFLNDFKIKQ
jgi:hypothetical protein